MVDKFLEFIKKYILGFNIWHVLVGVLVVGGAIILYGIIATESNNPEKYNDDMKIDAATVKLHLLEKDYDVLNKEISETNLEDSQKEEMRLLLDYEKISYHTIKVNNEIRFYITMVGTGKYKDYQLADYEI